MRKSIPIAVKRRIKRRLKTSTAIWPDVLNSFLTSFISVAMLAVAYATWHATQEQANIADTLARLEIAKSRAQFQFSPSKALVDMGGGINPKALTVPKSIAVRALSGVRSIDTLDGQAYLRIYGADGNYACDLEVRGIYIENDPAILTAFDEPVESLRTFLHALRKEGLTFDGEVHVLVRYYDLLGDEAWQQFRARDGFNLSTDWITSVSNPAVLYSGAWSNGQGFYFDKPPKECGRSAAEALVAAAAATKGESGVQ